MRTAVEHIESSLDGTFRCLVWESKTGCPLVCWPGMGGTAESFGSPADRVSRPVFAIDPPGTGAMSDGFPTLPRISRIVFRLS